MKRTLLVSLFALLVSSNAFADGPVLPSGATKVIPRPLPPIVLQYRDPAAARIDTTLLARATPFSGRVRITGVVKNLGTASYESGANQQLALLYEVTPGRAPRLVAQQAFQNLAPGAEVAVSYDRDWYAAGEFQPSYKLMIVYDPDILLDSNPKNDDWSTSNNVRVVEPGTLNALFH